MSSLRSRIDNAFHRALAGDSSPHQPGGFLPPSPALVHQGEQSSYIPLSHIPHALQLLDLPPDDEQVLAIFRNAASGWEDDHSSPRRTEGRVSLEDWRAVCDVLMDDGGHDEDEKEGNGIDDDDEDPDVMSNGSSPELEESSGGSSDEYRETHAGSRKRPRKSATTTATAGGSGSGSGSGATRITRARKTRSSSAPRMSPPFPSTNGEITPRQRRECFRTFLLFFPGVPEEDAKRRCLGVREVNAAAAVLNEKLKPGEIIEMLEAFSTSPDKAMSLSDFEKMMIATRLA